jgi:hypothetical protein
MFFSVKQKQPLLRFVRYVKTAAKEHQLQSSWHLLRPKILEKKSPWDNQLDLGGAGISWSYEGN